ncbi:TPA: tail fiber assembly protein [Citrobacter braakii]
MNLYFYSAKNNSFYPRVLQESYLLANTWPDDALPVDDDVSAKYMTEPPEGKMRVAGNDGLPAWADIPPPTQEEIIAEAELKKANLRAQAESEINWRQYAVERGKATEEEAAALIAWQDYRLDLMRVDTAKPEWPTPPVA